MICINDNLVIMNTVFTKIISFSPTGGCVTYTTGGRVPLQTIRACIQYGRHSAQTIFGFLDIKICMVPMTSGEGSYIIPDNCYVYHNPVERQIRQGASGSNSIEQSFSIHASCIRG